MECHVVVLDRCLVKFQLYSYYPIARDLFHKPQVQDPIIFNNQDDSWSFLKLFKFADVAVELWLVNLPLRSTYAFPQK